ncbi:MAG: glycosyltransferase [Tepidisphaera sp.]|nr:glycosyltransferase [Tepidisphaera sp.]
MQSSDPPVQTFSTKPAILGLETLTPTSNGHANGHQPASNGHSDASGPARVWKVAAVIPCFNRRSDLEVLLRDVAAQVLTGIELWCVVVDNASTQPLSTIAVPPGLEVEFVRLDKNSGGSGGFNAGMAHVLSGAGLTASHGRPDFIWWLDSDARAGRRCLIELVKVLARSPKIGAVGSAMGDLMTGHTWEVGGSINPEHGGVWPAGGGDLDRRFLVKAHYIAACSGLVRREAIEATGLFPDNFIYYDDVDWCIQMVARTGLKCVGAPRSRAFHPPGNRRYVTWARYYIARNCFSHMDVMKMGNWKRAKRAWREVPRAIGQAMMGLPELSELHLRGLQDARDKHFPRIEPKDVVAPVGFKPFTQLKQIVADEQAKAKAAGRAGTLYVHPLLKSRIPGLASFRRELHKLDVQWPAERRLWRRRSQETTPFRDMREAIGRLLFGPGADVAIVPTGWPTNWFRGRTLIQVTSEGLIVREVKPWKATRDAISVFWRGLKLCAQIGRRGPHIMPLPQAPAYRPAAARAPVAASSV